MASLDFEQYLQPTARCSLSPVQSMAVDRFSLGVEDAEMESPQAQAGEPVQDALMTPTGTLGVRIAGVFTLVFHGGGFKHVALTTDSFSCFLIQLSLEWHHWWSLPGLKRWI